MSTFSQNPDPSEPFGPLTEFDHLLVQVPTVTPFEAMWNAAEEELAATRPEGFTPEDIGELALFMLPDSEKPTALGELFYRWWESREERVS